MMKIRLTTFSSTVTPDITLTAEDGSKIQNRDLPDGDRITVELELPSYEKKAKYMDARFDRDGQAALNWRYDRAIRECVKKITGCLAEYYFDGPSLLDGPKSAEQDALIQDCFFRICGIRQDDDSPGDMTPGE